MSNQKTGIKKAHELNFGSEKASLDRPAWTSETSTGMFEAFNHKHCLEKGKFSLLVGYYGMGSLDMKLLRLWEEGK